MAVRYFGADKVLGKLSVVGTGRYLKGEALNKKASGQVKSARTVDRARRTFKAVLLWARRAGYLDTLPLPKSELPASVSGQAKAGAPLPTGRPQAAQS